MTTSKCTSADAISGIWTCHAALTRALDASLGNIHGIGLTEFMVLSHLNSAPQQSMRRIDLAEAVCRSASGVTRMLLPMEKIGLVKRNTHPRDARVSLVTLTNSGRKRFKEASTTMNDSSQYLLRNINAKQLDQLTSILGSLNSA